MARWVGKCAIYRDFPIICSEGNLVFSSLGRHSLASGTIVEKCAVYSAATDIRSVGVRVPPGAKYPECEPIALRLTGPRSQVRSGFVRVRACAGQKLHVGIGLKQRQCASQYPREALQRV